MRRMRELEKFFLSILAILALMLFYDFFSQAEENAPLDIPNLSLLEKERQIRDELEKKIQNDILDPMLGKGKAMVFVTLQLDVVTAREKLLQSGSGISSKSEALNKLFSDTEYILPGIPKPKSFEERPLEGKSRQAKQEQGQERLRVTQKTVVRNLEIVILHDEKLAKDVLSLVRERIIDALGQFQVKPSQVVLKSIKMQGKFLDDLRRPMVYLPTLFALLFLLFILFLFGPVASAMRGYVRTLEKREGPQVSVESEFKGAENLTGAGGGPGAMPALGTTVEGMVDTKNKKSSEELETEHVFSYINDENIGRLVYLLKREEPWVIAVVLTYLKPQYAMQILRAIPGDKQAQVAIETATIRQLSREQVIAIDKDIKERVNFIVGGIRPLIAMLEDAEPQIIESVLEYLKNEKPEIYEKIRKRLILFEDILNMPDRVVANLFRELKPVEVARALRGALPELEQKVFANMSSGAANLVKEEMELLGELTPEDILKQRRSIISTLKRLEAEGKVNFRENSIEGSLEGVEEDESKAAIRQRALEAKGIGKAGKEEGSPGPVSEGSARAPGQWQEPDRMGQIETFERVYEEGVVLHNEGRFEEAVERFSRALDKNPDSWEVCQYLGGCYYALGLFREALQCYERALDIHPTEELKEFVASLSSSNLQGVKG